MFILLYLVSHLQLDVVKLRHIIVCSCIHLFSLLHKLLLYEETIVYLPIYINAHVGCFQIVTFMNRASMNILKRVLRLNPGAVSSSHLPSAVQNPVSVKLPVLPPSVCICRKLETGARAKMSIYIILVFLHSWFPVLLVFFSFLGL